jgi:hypothetical protein
MTNYYRKGDTIPDVGVVRALTETGYALVNGDFIPFTLVHHPQPAAGLVVFSDGTRYGGPDIADIAADGWYAYDRARMR